jgi:hypothetical protein
MRFKKIKNMQDDVDLESVNKCIYSDVFYLSKAVFISMVKIPALFDCHDMAQLASI